MRGDDATHQDAAEPRSPAPKTRKRISRPPAADAGKRSLNLRIDDETYERLTVHSMKERTTISELVMEMTKTHCRKYSMPHVVGRTGAGQGASDGT